MIEIGDTAIAVFAVTVVFNAGAFWGVALFYRKVTNGRLASHEAALEEVKKDTASALGGIEEGIVDIRERVSTIEGHCNRMDCLKGVKP